MFRSDFAKVNEAVGIKAGPLVYRHTYAPHRAMVDSWSAIRIAREMGNSVAVVDKYYAGFFRPESIN